MTARKHQTSLTQDVHYRNFTTSSANRTRQESVQSEHVDHEGRITRMETMMSIKTRIAAVAVAALAVTGGVASTTTSAEAHGFYHGGFYHGGFHHGWGFGAGLLGAAVVGSAIAASNSYPSDYYDGYHRCGWVRRFDAFGNYIGTVRGCY
jgi:hypothetical protein